MYERVLFQITGGLHDVGFDNPKGLSLRQRMI